MTFKAPRLEGLFVTLPYVFVFSIWMYFGIMHPLSFWQMRGDYHWYSLSQAFTLEAKFAGFPAANQGYNVHPGVPFGFASWLALRMATWGISDPAEVIAYAVSHAERYWTCAITVALALNLAGILIFQWMFGRRFWLFVLAVSMYFAATPAVFNASLIALTNDSFAIVLIPLMYFMIYRLLTPEIGGGSDENAIRQESSLFNDRHIVSIAIGIIAALGWSGKIYYMAPAFGTAAGLITAVGMRALTLRTALRCVAYIAASFSMTVTTIVYFVLGWERFIKLITWNLKMLSHTNRYGSGELGFLQSGNVLAALERLNATTNGTLPAIAIAAVAVVIAMCFIRRNDRAFIQRNVPFLCSIAVGVAINLTGLVKHYAPHYALVICASLPCVLLILVNEKLPRPLMGIASALMLIGLVVNFNGYSHNHASDIRWASAAQRDLKVIEGLPISPGQKRVWGYHSPVKAGVVPSIAGYAGSPFVGQAIYGNADPVDVVPTSDRSAEDWKYVFFPKTYFPTRESVPLNYPKQFDFAVTKFEIEPTDRLDELEIWFVLTRDLATDQAPR